ncbi:phage tail tip fiber protein [Klebsiella pneumoniae]|uniref:phage tail tip fiber protein n=2 Tax=Klebsiella pneumoniae TaxID=573 RepID=UPI003B58C99E
MEVPNFKKSRLSQLITHGLIISGRGGSKGGGGARTPVEANDTVNSRAMASVLDLLGEGVIGGLVDGAKSILLNDTPLQNADGSYNFSGVTWWFRDGSQDQTVIDGFDFIETPKSVGMQLKQTSQVNVSLDSADSDRVRVVMKFPSLRKIDKKSGDTNGTTVQYKFQIDAGNGKGFVDAIAEGEGSSIITLTAKKTGVYYRSYVFDLPKPAKSYTLRAIRLTEDHKDDSYLYDDTYIDSIGEIVNTSLNYPNSALVGLKINSEQFGSTMPSRSYLIKGLKIRVPSNYNADTNSYDGNWDGTFKLASSSNPAWILFDLLTNTRYGLGEFVKESMINIGELYQIGRYCDAFVDDGFGGKEKRFAINTQITSRQDAYRVVQDIAGAFRGMVYWAGGMVHITQDSPADPVMLFSNSNVVNGSFAYKGSARKDRYSVALITYNNKEDGYKQSVEYVEDQEAIKRYGIRKTESVAFGCTSRGQAHRVGLWTLYTSRMESDVITFAVGMDSVFLMPGDIVLIADKFRAGRRNSGRITGYTYNSIKLDAPVDLTSVGNHITFLSAEGKMVERDILENGKNITTVTFKTALSSNETPVNDAVWVIAQPDLTPLQARVVSVAEGDDGTSFNITAIQNNPTKYEAIDSGAQLIPQNTTVLDPTFSKPSGLAITEGTYLSSPGNLSVSLTATWQGKSAQYYISWRRSDAGNVSNWKSERVTEEQFELRGVAENGQYDFQVYAVSVGGRKTDPISITYKVLGTMTAPDAPTGLTAVGDYRSIVLNWVNPASVDLDHIEVLASKTNDKSKAQLIAKVSGTTFSHNGLEDSVTWYYWVRAANKRGMLSALNSPLATVATTRDVLSFLQNKITESELGQDLIADINSKAVATEVDAAIDEAKSETKAQVDDARTEAANAVKSAKEALSTAINKETQDRAQAIANETTARNKAIADEASIRATAISNEVTARTNAIATEVEARTKAVADEATARAKAVSDEAIARASAITDSVAVEASNRAKAVSDATAALDAKISKEARDRASAVSALDIKTANAINTETLNRISSIEDEARARADALLQEKNNRQSEISNLSTQVQTVNESLAQQISQIAAGTGEQFDSLKIWYFDTNSEGWTEDDGGTVPMSVTDDGWLKSSNSTASCRSPNNMVIDANAYRFLKLRIKKVGKPTWSGKLYWIGASEQGWSESRSLVIDEPEYDANGVATLTIHDIDWRASTTIRRFRFDFLKNQSDTNNLLIDWVAVGRPTPGAGMAALQDEKSARVDADAAEAANRNALAVQMRGSYEGNDLSKVGSGLIFQEQLARVTADKAEAMARQSLETKVDDSVSNINKSLDTLNTQDKAMASDITGLKSSLKDKADASALQTLKTSVDQQGSSISTQGQSITKLQNDLSTTNANVSKKADQTALTALQGTVTQQGKDISAANSSITNLKTSLDTTNSNVAKKADATAVNDLTSRVSATEGKVSSQADSIVQLNNSLSNAIADSDVSTKTPNNLIINPSFERGTDGYIGVSSLSTVVAIQIPHVGTKALKIDPGSSVSPGQYIDFVKGRTYEIGVWAKQVSGTTDNGQGNNKLRVGNSAGAPVFEVPFANLTVDWTKVSKRWKATETGSLPVTLSNYLTAGNRYFDDFYVIDVTDSVAIDANASALSSLQNTVTQQGKDISSQSTSITDLNNSLKTTNDNVAKKADSSAVQTLQNTVTQQGKDISTATSDISSLKSGLATTDGNVAKKADASALQSLQNTVTQQGKDLTSVGSRTTALENSLKATNDNVATKADASSLSTLQNTVSQQGKDITSASDAITSLNNSVGAMTNMGDNLIQDANLEGDGSAFRTQQNSGTTGSIVAFGAYGENSAGARMLKVNATSPGLFANGKKPTPVNGSRKFRYIVRAKGVSGAMNMLLRRWNFNGNTEGAYEDKNNTLTTDWQTITWDTSFSPSTGADGQAFGIYCHPSNAEIWIDSFQVFDITDAVNNDATASALSDLSTKVTKQGDTVSSQGTSITKLQNDLTSTKTDVSKKADASALQTLQNTVTDQGKTLISQGNAITTLTNTVDTVKGDVAKKADATALNNLSTRVSNAEDKISSSSDAITSLNNSLSSAKADADAAKSVAGNMLKNNSFERGFEGWEYVGWTLLAAQSPKSGSYIIQAGKLSSGGDSGCNQTVELEAGKTYRIGAWVRKSSDFAINNAGNNKISLRNADLSAIKDIPITGAGLSTSWTLFSGEYTPTKTASVVVSLRASVASGYMYLDDVFCIDVSNEKAIDATSNALSILNSTVTQQGKDITSNSNSITSLSNQMVNGRQNMWVRSVYNVQLANNATEPTFSDINGKAPISIDEVPDAAKLDFASAGSYVIAHYKAFVKVNADTTITMAPGSRVFDDTGAVYVNGVRVAFGNSSWNTVSFDLKAGWSTVEFLVNQWTGQAYINLGFKLSEKVAKLNSALGMNALSNAISAVTSNVSTVGDRVTSTSQSVTDLRNSLEQTNANLANKADAQALSTLQNTVSKQGDTISSQGNSITKLTNDLSTTNSNVAKKADGAAVTALTNRVTEAEGNISSQSNQLATLSNSLAEGSLICNGGLNVDASFWEDSGPGSAFTYDANEKAIRTTTGSIRVANLTRIPVEAETTLTISFEMKASEAITNVSSDSVGVIDDLATPTNWISSVSPWLGGVSTNWQTKSVELTIPANFIGKYVYLRFAAGGWTPSNSARLYIRKVDVFSSTGVAKKANATAVSDLTSRVDSTEGKLASQSQALTKLQNDLATTNNNVSKKADQSALSVLSGRVDQTESGLSSANSSITALNSSVRAGNATSGDLISNPTFDPEFSQMGFTVVSSSSEGVPANCPYAYVARIAARDHHPNFAAIPATLGDVYEMSALVACGTGSADFNLYLGTATRPSGSVGAPLSSGGNRKASATWQRVTWRFKITQGIVDRGFFRPFLQINQSSPFGTVWYVTDWHLRNVTDSSKVQDSLDATAKAVDSLTSTVNQQGENISSLGTRATNLENNLRTTNANVAQKADANALTALTNRVTQTEKDINSTSSSVTNLNNKVDAISVGGTNLIKNSGDMTGWSNVVSDTYRGNAVIGATVKAGSGYKDLREITLESPVDAGEYVYSFYAKGGVAGQTMTAFFYNPNTTTSIETSQGAKGNNTDGRAYFTLTTSWVRYWVKWKQTPTTGTKRLILCRIESDTSKDQTVYINSPKFEVGNVVSDWNDSPSDSASASAVDSLTTKVNQQGTSISSIGNRTTSLENGLSTAQNNIAKKADASALQDLRNTVTSQGDDLTAANSSITSLQASVNRRTVFTVTARGNGNSVTHGVFDESGKNLFTPGRSWALVTFAKQSDGSTVIATSKTYDVFGSANNGATMSADIEALASGTYVCVLTFDEPSGNRGKILSALESLGGTSEVINSLPYRGAYILLGRKGMKPGDGLELRAPTGGDGTAHISTSVEFVNGVMMGLGAAGGVMMKADANASAITTLQNTVTQQGKDITSASSAITNLQNDLNTANGNINKKADATALSALQNTVTQQGKDISSQGSSLTQLTNSLNATNDSIDASGQIPGNMITNASFERDNGGYSTWSGPASVMVAQSPRTGNKILKIASGSPTLVGQKITYVKGRTYKIGMWARQDSNTTINGGTSNTKFRVADSTGLIASFGYGPFTTSWQEISWVWKATKDMVADTQITAYLSAGAMYFDDFYVIDITDRVDLDATTSAVSGLTTRVSNAEGDISNISNSVTSLNNSLSTLNKTVSSKADASALSSLQNTVTQQGKDLSSASGSVTDLKSSLNTLKVQSNPWIDGTFETYDNNQQLGGSTAIVTTDFKSSGSKCLKVTRPANTSGNSDKMIGSYSAVRQSAKYRVEFWAMMPASEAPPSGWTVVVGLHSINKDGGNDWQGITFNEAGLGGRDQWVKFTGVVKVSPSVTRSHVWISTRGQSGSNTPGYAVYIDDFVITDITDAADAQATADANATAISSLQTKVSDIDGKVTAQTSQLSSMQSKVDASSSKVDQLSKTISDSQSTQASLNTSLQSQIDAQASANIKNQADLNSATTSIASIKSTQATQATQISAMAKTQTDMTASLNSQSASIQTLQEAVSNNDALNSTWMVKMQTNNNGQKYAAGIALGVDGKNMQSQFLVQADRFALINTSNGNTTTPFVIDNGVTYMNAAYIKDGSIGSAKVGDLMSSGFQENVRGWRISRDGTMNINGSGPGSSRTVITNGKIEVYDSNNRLRVRMGIF